MKHDAFDENNRIAGQALHRYRHPKPRDWIKLMLPNWQSIRLDNIVNNSAGF